MPRKRLVVVVTRKLPEPVETRMRELFEVRLNDTDTAMTEAELAGAMATADVLVPTVTDRIGQKLLAQAGENLKLIANYGAGFDHIDVETARRRGMLVSYTPGVLPEDTADMTMALILAVTPRIKEGTYLIQSGAWKGWSPSEIFGIWNWGARHHHL